MSIMKPTASDKREITLNSKIKVPKDAYILRCTSEEFKMSKLKLDGSGNNPMIELGWEFISPETITGPNGETVTIAGCQIFNKTYLILRINDKDGKIDPEKSQKAFNAYCDFRNKLGKPVDPEIGVDVENPEKVFSGVCVHAIVDCDEVIQRREPTPEQKAQGKEGDIIKINGVPIKSYFPKIVSIEGLADPSVAGNMAF